MILSSKYLSIKIWVNNLVLNIYCKYIVYNLKLVNYNQCYLLVNYVKIDTLYKRIHFI